MEMQGMFTWFLLVLIFLKMRVINTSSVKMVFGGDITFNGILEYMVNKEHCTYEESLERLEPYLTNVDYTVVNLESVVFGEYSAEGVETEPNKVVHSIADATALKSLKSVGINCVSLANSHIDDFLDAGINSTCQLCEKHGIEYFGVSYGNLNRYRQKPLILEKHGIKIGLLGYCATEECLQNKDKYKDRDGASLFSVPVAISQAKELRQAGCHAVIMFMNWEMEYRSMMTTESILNIKRIVKQVKIDLIVGSHPHVTHGHWIVNDTLVASSLGNLIAPSFMTAGLNFERPYINETDKMILPLYETLWYKQMNVMNDPSRHGKLLKVTINKNGIITKKSQYLTTRIFATDKHCMVVDKDISAKWKSVCDGADPECMGTKKCNYLQCDNKNPLPHKIQ